MQVLLQIEGYDVELAGDGHAGLAAVAAKAPDLVIVDQRMPGMSGHDTIRALRASVPQVPIIAASGAMAGTLPGTEDEPEQPEPGADFNLRKPFRPRELIEAVRRVLGLEQKT